jgi:transcriptional regulator with XRE-family HTH domain
VPGSLHPILETLGITIRLLRQQRSLSQEALANLANIDRSYMSGIERGHRNISLLNMARIATALRVSLTDLLSSVAGVHAASASAPDAVEGVHRASEAVADLTETLSTNPEERARAGEWQPGESLSLS